MSLLVGLKPETDLVLRVSPVRSVGYKDIVLRKHPGEIKPYHEWMDMPGLRRYVAVSERTARDWINSPEDPLPASRIKGKIYVRRTDVDEWMLRHRISRASSDLDAIADGILRDLSE